MKKSRAEPHFVRKADNAVVNVTILGAFVNSGLAVLKLFGGYIFASQSLLADGYHSLEDLAGDVLLLVGVYLFGTSKNHWGETLLALGVSGMLAASAMTTVYVCADELYRGSTGNSSMGDLGLDSEAALEGTTQTLGAATLAAAAIIVKEWIYRKSESLMHSSVGHTDNLLAIAVSKQCDSPALAASALHHRMDSLTSFVALATSAATYALGAGQLADHVGSMLISLMLLKAAGGSIYSMLRKMLA